MQLDLFGAQNYEEMKRLDRLTQLGDNLLTLNTLVDWELFRPLLQKVLHSKPREHGGRPRYDVVMMFKILVLQRLYNLSDDQMEYQITDRMSFMRFLGLNLEKHVPDAKTIWHFREELVKAQVIDTLFDLYGEQMEASGFVTHRGSIQDATFVEVPRQRNTPEENARIKAGEVPEEWLKDENRNKRAQKDTDARWTKKGGVTYYGYKNHIKIDADSKLILSYETTSANVHDSQILANLVDETDKILWADSAYAGEPVAAKLPPAVELRIHERAYRGHPLTEEQKASNKEKSKVRVRIEHVFGAMTIKLHGLTARCIGKARVKFNIGLTNIVYNIDRFICLCRMKDRGIISVAQF